MNCAQCIVDGCSRPHWAGGYCSPHYQRVRKHGAPGPAKISTGKGQREAWLRAHASYTEEQCLIWPFSYDPSGYGAANWRDQKRGAHRVMCIIAHGEPENSEMHAAHTCGNKACVNPKHLRWATPSENQMDKYIHGRMPVGEKNPSAVLTAEAVAIARARRAEGHSFTSIGKDLNVSRHAVARACAKKTWRHA